MLVTVCGLDSGRIFLSSPTVEFIHHISDPFTVKGISITPLNLIITGIEIVKGCPCDLFLSSALII